MTEHVDPLDGVLVFNWRRPTVIGGLLNYLRHFSCVIIEAFRGSSKLVTTPNSHSFAAMASAEPIDISSSDSDDSDLWEIDNYREDSPSRDTATTINGGVPPSQASSSRPKSAGHNVFSHEVPSSSKRQFFQYDSPVGNINHSSSFRKLPSWAPKSTGINGPSLKDPSSSKRRPVYDEIPSRPQKRLNIGEASGSSTSRIDNNIHPTKRVFPGFQPCTSNPQFHNLIENRGATEIRETLGKSVWSTPSNGSRVLPQTMMPGKYSSTTPLVGLKDSFHQTGVGEERPAGPDERFVFQAAVQDIHQHKREATFPDGLLSVSLLKHQKIALAWMLRQESSGLCIGGILADDQGLGKTISTMALILMQKNLEAKSEAKQSSSTKTEAFNLDDDDGVSGCVVLDDANQIEVSDGLAILPQASNSTNGFRSSRPRAGTLIICPASVIRQWDRELDEKVTKDAKLQGPIARDSVVGYQKLQLVLRNILLRRTKGDLIDGKPIINLPPKKVHLKRVEFSVEERAFYEKLELDSRKQFKAYAAAGTVNQNYANILLMLLRLRQACDHPLLVKGLSSDPIGKDSSKMAKNLPRELQVNLLKQLEASLAICLVCQDPPENAVVTMCGHVFCYQCVSDHLTGEDNTCPAHQCKEQLGADVVFSRSTLRRCLSIDVDGDSPVPDELCDESTVLQRKYVSSKIKSVLEILNSCVSKRQSSESHDLVIYDASSSAVHEHEPVNIAPEKAIVFSQWTSMLDLVEMSLKNNHISYRRLDGTMSIVARDKAVKEFNTDPEVDVMLMSLKAGNLGLNMVSACRVILLDLWWNPTTEDQAIDRAHRIGQTRTVTVSRLTVKDTVEDRILSLQDDKRKMVASAFGEDKSGSHGTRLTAEDLRFLFEGSGR
ncbi:helicase-like transcription factor CHR28 isoform X3 [Salvia hispanica]|uniref:helicase-like transcription factor CHR28 isoform X3 n=1 Tax=Salvia hispanica TaxID=49212 RepID=UPI002009CF76|nr:helicase-like transcription factor CHR28 isoform X3 [Salvia hispanica]